jgi:glutathione S-transferase
MKLYLSPGACSLASHIVLEEIGQPYETEKIALRDGQQRTPQYLAINWKGKVPALVLDDGQTLTENPVITSYLADKYSAAGLLAPPGDLARARAQEWLAWCASGVQPAFGPLFGPSKYVDDAAAQANLTEKARATVERLLAQFGDKMGAPYVLGERFSIADAYTLVFWKWATDLFKLKTHPRHRAAVEKLLDRAAIQRVLAAEGLKITI